MVIKKTFTRPRIKPYGFQIDYHAHEICIIWCEEEFGELEKYNKGRWTHRINHVFYRFGGQRSLTGAASVYFTNEVDAMAFKLRWL